jgi:hypothetical protein
MVIPDNSKNPDRENPKTVIPVEIGSSSCRVSQYDPVHNNEGISVCLDLLQERRDDAQAVGEAYRARVARYYYKTVNPRKF